MPPPSDPRAKAKLREFLLTWELVAKVPFFHNIGASLIAEVARLLRPRDYPAGAIVMRRGQPGDCMYFVASGEVEVQLNPEPVILGPGEFFGTRQTGLPEFRVANLIRDRAVLELARAEAERFAAGPDPAMPAAETAAVWERLKQQWQRRYGLVEA